MTKASLSLVGKLWMKRSFNIKATTNTMKLVWSARKGMELMELGFNHKKDKQFILNIEPWHFDKIFFVIKEIKHNEQRFIINPFETPVRVRAYDLPLHNRTRTTTKMIGITT